jgi:D-alanine-D-alanine ligase-like ATP-grasp enzyme
LPDDFQEEFDSPATVEAIAEVLRGLGHEVDKLGDGRELIERLLASPPDFVFNIAEGYGISRSREARVPALLEMLGIPFTGSDPLTLAVTLDKDCAKRLVQSFGVAVPRSIQLEGGSRIGDQKKKEECLRPSIRDLQSSIDFFPVSPSLAGRVPARGFAANVW